MARPRTPIGTYGAIRLTRVDTGGWEARAWFRDADGRLKHPRRRAATKKAAEHALKTHLADLAAATHGAQTSSRTTLAELAAGWFDDVQREVAAGTRAHNTERLYRGYLDNHILPALGALQAREVSVTVCDRFLKRKADDGFSYNAQKSVRAVLSGVCGYAVRHGAMGTNPIRSVARLSQGSTPAPRALTDDERSDLLAQLDANDRARRRDLPDLVRVMLATGVRIGELLAVTGDDIDLDARNVRIAGRVIRVKGRGLERQDGRKGGAAGLTLDLPEWVVPLLRRRKLAAGPYPLFPSTRDGWRDPSNVMHMVREDMDAAGYGWVTSHVFRKTVATVLDRAGLPTTAIADQLGNTPNVVQRHYRAPRTANPGSAAALESLGD